jgi:ABC-type dipeptide/oligopeptide/nickel transport system permease component
MVIVIFWSSFGHFAVKKDRAPDHAARIYALGGCPSIFWLGILLQLVLYYYGWLPVGTDDLWWSSDISQAYTFG